MKAIPPILCCGVRPLASALLLAIIAGVARGDGKVVATYLKTDPAASFAFKTQPQDRFVDAWKNQKGQFTRKSGRLEWQVPETEPGTGRMGREFSTYCAEALVGVVPGKTYQFDVQEPNVPEAFGLPDDPAGWAEADRRARFVRELFGRYYPDSLKDGAAAQCGKHVGSVADGGIGGETGKAVGAPALESYAKVGEGGVAAAGFVG